MKKLQASGSLSLCCLLLGLAGCEKVEETPSRAAPMVASVAEKGAPRSALGAARAPAGASSRLAVATDQASGSPAQARLSDFAFYVDPAGTASVEEVADLAARQPTAFTATAGYYGGGYAFGAKWLKFTVSTPPGEWWVVVLPPFLDDIRLYEPAARGWIEHRSGDMQPFGVREAAYRGFAFCLRPMAGDAGPRRCFLRLQTTSTNQMLPRLLSGEQFRQATLIESVALLGLVGGLLLMAAINLVSYFPLRDRIHLLFVFALLLQAALYLTTGGFTAQFFLPDHPAIASIAVGLLTLIGFSIFGLFYIEFLHITPQQRVTYFVYRSLQWGALLVTPSVWTDYFPVAMQWAHLLFVACVVLSLPCALGLWRQAVPGRNLIVGVVLFQMGGLLVQILSQVGILPVTMVTLHAAPMSSFGTIALAHLALLARQHNLRAERIRAERDAARERELRVQMENFIDVVSHEYRTPLAVLETNLFLLNSFQGETQRRGSLRKMHTAVERLTVIFNRTLHAGKWEGLRRMTFTPLELEGLLRSFLVKPGTLWCDFAAGVRLESSGPVHILADRLLLETVLTNVLENACHYAAPGGPIEVSLKVEAGWGQISVTNTYDSALRLDAAALFERAVRGPNASGIPGTGMGLFLVKKLVEDQHGQVALDLSRAERFTLTLSFPSVNPLGQA